MIIEIWIFFRAWTHEFELFCSSFLPFEFAKLIGAGDPETTFAKSKIPPIVEQDLVLDYLPSRYASPENPGFGKCIGFVLHSFFLEGPKL